MEEALWKIADWRKDPHSWQGAKKSAGKVCTSGILNMFRYLKLFVVYYSQKVGLA